METKYYVDKDGNYLGGYAGVMVGQVAKANRVVKDSEGVNVINDNGSPLTEEYEIVEEVFISPDIPLGAIQVTPPDHGWQKYDVKKKKWLPLTDEQKSQLAS